VIFPSLKYNQDLNKRLVAKGFIVSFTQRNEGESTESRDPFFSACLLRRGGSPFGVVDCMAVQ
jgi:predicted fused transcriptional regulator/phosphomethylpyrimidine kinase